VYIFDRLCTFIYDGYWVNYDEQYRLRKATSPSSSWGVVDMELWMLCVSIPPSGNIGFGNVERQSRNSPPIAHTSHTVNLGSTLNFQRRSDTNNSVCRLFNRGLQCKFGKKFKYSHRCTKCNGNHPITNCRLNLTLYNICFANFRGAHAPHAPSKSASDLNFIDYNWRPT
jgi:hypothetical protein